MIARHKLTAGAVALGAGFVVLSVALALGQWDPGRVTFPAESGVDVRLGPGERRIIYMTADESAPMNFDFYPSDFTCMASGPVGDVPVRREDHHRLLDAWGRHRSVGSLVADDGGRYRISCRGRRDAPLILASPARFTVGWVSPAWALLVLLAVLIASALVQALIAVGRGVARRHASHPLV